MNARPNIVLVHGAWADGSCWSAVIERLQAGGYQVSAPQFPLTALEADVARLRQAIGLHDGPVIAFLASPKASYVTGAVFAADGGRTAI